MRPIVNKEFPGIKFVELGKLLGERWRALTPEQKKQYEEMAAEDKVRFQIEMQQYTANQAAAALPAPTEAVVSTEAVAPQDHGAAAFFDPNVAHAALHPVNEYNAHHAQSYHHDPYNQQQYHAA